MVRSAILAVFGGLAVVAPATAQTPGKTIGTLVVAHGGDSIWNAQVRQVLGDLRLSGPAELSFLMGPEASKTRFQDAVGRLVHAGAQEVVVVPLLVSSHSGHFEQIRYLIGETDSLDRVMHEHLHHGGIERPQLKVAMRITAGLDDSPELARVLTDRARASVARPAGRALMLVGHGPNSAEDYAAWMKNLRVVADSVRRWSGFEDVRVELVREDAPALVRAEAVARLRELIAMQARLTNDTVVVVPILVSRGGISRSRILKDIEGLPARYAESALVPHPAIAAWITRRATR
ncbi:MAG TPA: CbiX/SirB N-terminal domain-containing protein [Gemmatimonadaceae bacterium]